MSDNKEKKEKKNEENEEKNKEKNLNLEGLKRHFENGEAYNPDSERVSSLENERHQDSDKDDSSKQTSSKHTKESELEKESKNEEMDNMNDKAYMTGTSEGAKSPQESGLNPGKFEEYGETVLSTIDLSYDDISKFLMDAVRELNPVKVDWIRFSHDKLTQSIKADTRATIDTIVKITGANYRDQKFVGGFEAIPILVFDQKNVLTSVGYNENLGAISRDMYELDFDKLKKKNQKFFPRYGMVTSYDQANNLVRVHVNIINVIISALGYEPGDFGSPKEMDKLFLFPKQDPQNESFKVTIINNKYFNDRVLNAVKNM